MRKLIGHVSVDSGTIMIIDPCYVLPDDRGDGDDGLNYPTECHPDSPFNDSPSSVYLRAVGHTAENGDRYGAWHLGMITGTYYGDGSYPVYAEIEGSRVRRITIDFDPGSDEDDDDEVV